jgi:UDP-N-acetylglucosamine--dolichyl-phosphate N-acetylglucosaminephosphotransferase
MDFTQTMNQVWSGLQTYQFELLVAIVLSSIGYYICQRYIPRVMVILFERNIYGIDINKSTKEKREEFGKMRKTGVFSEEYKKLVIPESLGIVVGGVYLCVVFLILVLTGIPLAQANGAVTSVTVMLLLGFVDDVLDVKWRYKILLSFFGAIPLVLPYDGSLSVVVPVPLRDLVGSSVVYLGPLYLVYMMLLCIFCCNSINILAGVNGVEVGQSIVIAVASIAHNVVQLRHGKDHTPHNLLALMILIPFLFVSVALWTWNRFPSRVFVGDSYTYFAGITLAVAGICGQYSKTLLLFFIPQVINFVISLPQLFHIVPCPRHRVPSWDSKRNVLVNSKNYTILNLILLVCGDMHERTLTNVLIAFQVICCVVAFQVRYMLAAMVFEQVV